MNEQENVNQYLSLVSFSYSERLPEDFNIRDSQRGKTVECRHLFKMLCRCCADCEIKHNFPNDSGAWRKLIVTLVRVGKIVRLQISTGNASQKSQKSKAQ
jgi:hypothetical protein